MTLGMRGWNGPKCARASLFATYRLNLLRALLTSGTITSDDATPEAERELPRTKAVGPALSSLQKDGLIRPAPVPPRQTTRTAAHARKLTVWEMAADRAAVLAAIRAAEVQQHPPPDPPHSPPPTPHHPPPRTLFD